MSFKPMYKTGVWLNKVEHEARKVEQKELQMIRKNEIETKKIVHEIVDNIIEKIIKAKKEEDEYKMRNTKYIRPRIRVYHGKRIPRDNKLKK